VLGQIHGAHFAGVQLAGDAVVADNLSDLHRRSISRSAARTRSRPGTLGDVPASLARRCPVVPAPGVPRDRTGRETRFASWITGEKHEADAGAGPRTRAIP
jgi:hypothetical protein